MRISDWISDVCSSDLRRVRNAGMAERVDGQERHKNLAVRGSSEIQGSAPRLDPGGRAVDRGDRAVGPRSSAPPPPGRACGERVGWAPYRKPRSRSWRTIMRRTYRGTRSEEHTSELQPLMRSSYA